MKNEGAYTPFYHLVIFSSTHFILSFSPPLILSFFPLSSFHPTFPIRNLILLGM